MNIVAFVNLYAHAFVEITFLENKKGKCDPLMEISRTFKKYNTEMAISDGKT